MALADTAKLIVQMDLKGNAVRGLQALDKQIAGLNRGGLRQMGRGLGQVGSGLDTLGTRAAVAAAGGLAAVVTTAASFESAFAGVAKTVDATDAELDDLEGQFRALAREIPLSFEELAAIGEQGGAIGIAKEDLIEFTRVVAQLAATTDLSADTAATSLGQLQNVLHLGADDLDNFGAALVDLGNKGASTESQIVEIAARAGAAGDLIGLSADEVLGFGSAVANLGIEVEAGGTSLQKFFLETLKNIQDDDTLQVMAETAGTTGAAFKKAFEKDASEALQTFIEGLGDLTQAEQLAVLEALGFSDQRITRALLGLAGDTDNLSDSLDTAAEGWKENTALAEEFRKRQETTAALWQVFKNNARDALNTVGVELLPVASEAMRDFVGFLNEPGTQAGLKDFAKDLAGGIKSLVTELKGTDFSGIIGGLKIAASVAKGAFDAFRALPQPIQQLAIAALVANKVSGGAIGSIAAGLGNLLLGSLKTITAGHVTVVGGSVTGGPGVGGKGGGGLIGGLGRGLATGAAVGGGVVLAGIAGTMLVDFVGKSAARADELNTQIKALPADTGAEISTSIDKIDRALAAANGSLLSTIVTSVSNTQSHLETQRAILVGELQKVQAGSANASSIASAWSAKHQAAYVALNSTQKSQLTASTNASSVASSWSAKHSAAYAAMNAKNSALVDLSRSSAGYNARTASASETSRSTLAAIRNKRSTVNVTVNSQTNVSLSAAQMALRVTQINQTIGSRQDIDAVLN